MDIQTTVQYSVVILHSQRDRVDFHSRLEPVLFQGIGFYRESIHPQYTVLMPKLFISATIDCNIEPLHVYS